MTLPRTLFGKWEADPNTVNQSVNTDTYLGTLLHKKNVLCAMVSDCPNNHMASVTENIFQYFSLFVDKTSQYTLRYQVLLITSIPM